MDTESFDKYKKLGDYHWHAFKNDHHYRAHALKVKDWVEEKDILDVGGGDGLIASMIGAEVIDPDELAVSFSTNHGVTARVGNVYDLSNERHYEAVFFGDVLEHLSKPEIALAQIKNITNKLYLATRPREGKLRPYHLIEWTEEELVEFLEECGWKVLEHCVAIVRVYAKCLWSADAMYPKS